MDTRIYAFGDSIMKGVVMDESDVINDRMRYSICQECFVNTCSELFGNIIVNHAKFGSTISLGNKMLDRHLDKIGKGDMVVMEFGGNDCDFDWRAISENPFADHKPKTSIEEFLEIYNQMIDKIEAKGAKPIILSLPPLVPDRFVNYISQGLNKENILTWLCGDPVVVSNWHETYNLEVFKLAARRRVDIIDITSAFLNRHNYQSYICEDGMHPNAAGHRLITNACLDFKRHLATFAA